MWIADVFGRERAEQIDLDDIALLFHRTREMDVLERPENHIILGAKGSGKSTALRALTWRTWTQRAPGTPIPFVGVYLPMSYEEVEPFCLAYSERQSSEPFEHFFVASLFMELCIQREATYVVADISDLGLGVDKTPGVFYEIGLAVAQRKPLAFFYNCREPATSPSFNPDLLPTILRGQTVLLWDKGSENFLEAFTRVHQKLLGYHGTYDQPLDGRPPTSADARSGRHAYLSFQPRNAAAEDWFADLVGRLFPELRIERSRSWQADDAPLLTELVANAAVRIIDCTGGVNSQAIELGIAAATDSRRTIEVWNVDIDRRLNPVAMFPGHRFAWTDLGAENSHLVITILQSIARSTPLGTTRP